MNETKPAPTSYTSWYDAEFWRKYERDMRLLDIFCVAMAFCVSVVVVLCIVLGG